VSFRLKTATRNSWGSLEAIS